MKSLKTAAGGPDGRCTYRVPVRCRPQITTTCPCPPAPSARPGRSPAVVQCPLQTPTALCCVLLRVPSCLGSEATLSAQHCRAASPELYRWRSSSPWPSRSSLAQPRPRPAGSPTSSTSSATTWDGTRWCAASGSALARGLTARAQGWHNPTARTPNLDGLVKEGVELDRFYTFKYCSPTRSSFLSGRLPVRFAPRLDSDRAV